MLDEIRHDKVTCIAFSPDGRLFATGSDDRNVILWRVSSMSYLKSLECDSRINAISFSPDGTHLAAGLNDGEVKLWHITEGELNRITSSSFDSGLGGVGAIAFSSDGNLIVAGGNNGQVRAWSFPQCVPMSDVRLSSGMVFSIDFHPSDLIIAVGVMRVSMNIDLASAWIWNLRSGKARPVLGHTSSVFAVKFSPSGEFLATGGGDGVVGIWRMPDLRRYALWQEGREISSLEFTSDGRFLMFGTLGGSLKSMRIMGQTEIKTLGRYEKGIIAIALSPDARLLAIASGEGRIRIWEHRSMLESETGSLRERGNHVI